MMMENIVTSSLPVRLAFIVAACCSVLLIGYFCDARALYLQVKNVKRAGLMLEEKYQREKRTAMQLTRIKKTVATLRTELQKKWFSYSYKKSMLSESIALIAREGLASGVKLEGIQPSPKAKDAAASGLRLVVYAIGGYRKLVLFLRGVLASKPSMQVEVLSITRIEHRAAGLLRVRLELRCPC